MKITIITICYNAVNTIENTIQSVINQTYNDIEYIIIDGASDDGTMDVVNKYRNRISTIVSEPDKGIYDAMNKGIRLATGDWINFMNAGDKFVDDDVIKSFFNQMDASTIIAYGDANFILSSDTIVWKPYSLKYMKDMMCFCHQATFVRSSYHKDHLFDTSYKSSGDYKLLYDAYFKDNVKFQYIPVVVADYEAEGGISANNYCLRLREDARIKGIDRSLKWKLKYYFAVIAYYTKQFFKPLIPKKALAARTKRIMNNRH